MLSRKHNIESLKGHLKRSRNFHTPIKWRDYTSQKSKSKITTEPGKKAEKNKKNEIHREALVLADSTEYCHQIYF